MDKFQLFLMAIIGVGFLFPILSAIFNFFNIQPSTYLIYIAWTAALVIFYIILPGEVGFKFPALVPPPLRRGGIPPRR